RRGLRRAGGRNRGRNHAEGPLFGQAHRRARQGQSHGEDSAQIAGWESAPLEALGRDTSWEALVQHSECNFHLALNPPVGSTVGSTEANMVIRATSFTPR